MKQAEFQQWMKDQIRQAGEELIRRSEQMSFDGWDAITDISISCTIPTYGEYVEVPSIDFTFSCYNKTSLDALINKGHSSQNIVLKDHEHNTAELEETKNESQTHDPMS